MKRFWSVLVYFHHNLLFENLMCAWRSHCLRRFVFAERYDHMFANSFKTGVGVSAVDIPWDVHLPATSAQPDRAVVIAYGSDGMAPAWAPEILRHAKALTDVGIVALIPDYLHKSPSIRHGQSDTVFSSILGRHGEWEQVLQDAVKTAASTSGITSIGLLCFSLGGFLGLRIRDSVDLIVAYFSPYKFPTFGVPLAKAPLKGLEDNANPRLNALIQHGDNDSLVPFADHALPICHDLRHENATVICTPFPGANHGFQGSDQANVDARDQSCLATRSFFTTHL